MPSEMLQQVLPTLPFGRMALFLDVDGTLLYIAPTPESVVVPEGLPDLLVQLHRSTGGALALVSGRPIIDLDRLFSPVRLPAAGQHGAEWRLDPNDLLQRVTLLPDALRHQCVALAEAHPGVLAEDKGGAVALHVRARPDLTEEIAEALASIVASFPDYEVLGGKAVFEVRRRGVHKGAAVATLLNFPPFVGRTPVFVGDDTTDLDAIELVNARHGHGLLVAPTGPLCCPMDVRRWLASLLSREPGG